MKKYTVFFGQTATGYSAHVPDLPGCVAAGATLEETRQLIREAILTPTTHVEQIEVPA